MTAAAGMAVKAAQVQQASQDRNVVAAQELGRGARKRRLRIVVRDRAAEAIVFQQPDRLEFQDRLRRARDVVGDRQHINQPLTDRWRILVLAQCHRPVELGEPAFRLRRQDRTGNRRRELASLGRRHALDQQRRHMLAVEADRARAGAVDLDPAIRPDAKLDRHGIGTALRPLHPAFNACAVVGHVGNEGAAAGADRAWLCPAPPASPSAGCLRMCAAARARPRCCLDASRHKGDPLDRRYG